MSTSERGVGVGAGAAGERTARAWQGEDWMNQPSRTAVLLSGGAPTMHFISGALSAFYKAQVKFDVIAASGAGALPGLLYAAPKNGDVLGSLRGTTSMNVEDIIYEHLPTNYKVFQKAGPLSKPLWELTRRLAVFNPDVTGHYSESLGRLYNDSIQLMGALMSPSTLNYKSTSMCARIESFLDDVVAWDKVPDYDGQYVLNAFNLDRDRLEVFCKDNINATSFFAALAMCWLYPPSRYNGQLYTEGASHDPSAIEALWVNPHTQNYFDRDKPNHIQNIVAIETVRPDMWRDPRDLYDSLSLTIMDPLVALSEQMMSVYGRLEYRLNALAERHGNGPVLPKLYIVPFTLPSWAEARAMDWNYSNGLMLWDTGYESARRFCQAFRPEITPNSTPAKPTDAEADAAQSADAGQENPFEAADEAENEPALAQFRYHDYARTDQAQARRKRYLAMFDDLLDLLDD